MSPTAVVVEVVVTTSPENTSVPQIKPTSAPTIITVVATPTMDQTREPTSMPDETTTPTQTTEPTKTQPSEEPTPTPTIEPTPTAEASPTLIAGPEWLELTNRFRLEAKVPQLVENADWSDGSASAAKFWIKETPSC